jgi:hypothetical protein
MIWGRCPCGGEYEHRQIEVRMTVQGTPVILNDVCQGVCPNCGSRVYKAGQLSRIEQAMKGTMVDEVLSTADRG